MNSDFRTMLQLPQVDSKPNYLEGFWRWIDLLAGDSYEAAVESLYWPKKPLWTPEELKTHITTFFRGADPWYVGVPNARLVQVINDAAKFQPQNRDGWGGSWPRSQIPDPTNDGAGRSSK